MTNSLMVLLWTLMAHFFSHRHNAEIRFLKAQICILHARVSTKLISPTPEEKSELLRLGEEFDHDVADIMEIVKPSTSRRWIKGKFLMSINDTPEIREMFGRFTIEEVSTRYLFDKYLVIGWG